MRLVVEREREITAFVAREYWSLEAVLATPDGTQFGAEVSRIAGKTLEIGDGDTARAHAAALRTLKPVVDSVTTRPSKRNPAPPFTTSTLQQEASRKLGFSPKRTMSVAQRLYEGADTPDGHVGLITYMRTDSTAIAGVAMAEAQELIRDRFGDRYGTGKGRFYKTSAKGAQEAHESIRPTSFLRDPDSLQGTLEGDELRLYRLIWQRAVASQMASKEVETTTVELVADDYRLRASAMRTIFDGYARVYTEGQDDSAEEAERSLPPLAAGDVTSIVDVTPNQHFTEPPPRFTEASLIKALEEHGIGRPSTYAATISTIVERGYVRVEQRRLHPEVAAYFVTDYLVAQLRRLRRRRVHRRHGGGSRQGRERRARVGAAAARVLPAAQGAGRRAQGRPPGHRADRRGLLRGSPDGRSASGATARSWPAPRTPSTRRRGRSRATRRRSSTATASPAPSAARGP